MVTEAYIVKNVLPAFANIVPKERFGTQGERIHLGMERLVEESYKVRREEYTTRMKAFDERARAEGWGFFKKLFSERPKIRPYVHDRELYELCVQTGLSENVDSAEQFVDSLVSSVVIPHIYDGSRDNGITIIREENGLDEKRYYVFISRFDFID